MMTPTDLEAMHDHTSRGCSLVRVTSVIPGRTGPLHLAATILHLPPGLPLDQVPVVISIWPLTSTTQQWRINRRARRPTSRPGGPGNRRHQRRQTPRTRTIGLGWPAHPEPCRHLQDSHLHRPTHHQSRNALPNNTAKVTKSREDFHPLLDLPRVPVLGACLPSVS